MNNLNGEVGDVLGRKILELEVELEKYRRMLKVYKTSPSDLSEVKVKRKYKKRRKKRKALTITKAYKKRIQSPEWRKVIPAAIKAAEKPLTVKELVKTIIPGTHRKTKRVITGRCSAILSVLRKEGIVKSSKKTGSRVTYTLAHG